MLEEYEFYDIPVDVNRNDIFQLRDKTDNTELGPTVIVVGVSLKNIKFRVLTTSKVFNMEYHCFINSYYKIEDDEHEDRSQ